MTKFLVKDHSGMMSVHYAEDENEAIQRHLLHYGLLNLPDGIEVSEVEDEVSCLDEPCGTLSRVEVLGR